MRSLLTVIFVLASLPLDARPCSLAAGPQPGALPRDSATLNARPLLFVQVDVEPTLTLLEPTPTPIALELVDTLAGTFSGHTLMRAWRPAAPLATGQYLLVGAAHEGSPTNEVRFFVDPTLPLDAPALVDATLLVTLDDSSDSGCGFSCGNLTRLEIRVPEATDADLLRIEVRNPRTGLRRIELAAIPSFAINGLREVPIWNDQGRWPGSFRRAGMCVQVTPLTEFGAIGPTADLGCFDPQGDDPRVVDESGCGGATHGGTMGVWFALLFIIRARGTMRPTRR